MEDWLLVKRFLPISYQSVQQDQLLLHPSYEDDYKLKLFRSIRFISKLELIYSANKFNQISLPLLILEYKLIKFSPENNQPNLTQKFLVEMIIRYKKGDQLESLKHNIDQILLPIILFLVLIVSLARFLFKLRRRRNNTSNINEFTVDSFSQMYAYLIEIIYLAAEPLATALVSIFVIHIILTSFVFMVQTESTVTAPLLEEHQQYLTTIICLAFGLQVHSNQIICKLIIL